MALDPLTIAPWIVWRKCFKEWISKGPSDVSGCLSYECGSYCLPALKDMVDMPLISQLENLADKGWDVGRGIKEVHQSPEDKRLCLWPGWQRSPLYLECIRRLGSLLENGLPGLVPMQLNSYYRAALVAKDKSAVIAHMKNDVYTTMIQDSLASVLVGSNGILDSGASAPVDAIGIEDGQVNASDEDFEAVEDPIISGGSLQNLSIIEDRKAQSSDDDSEDDPFHVAPEAHIDTGVPSPQIVQFDIPASEDAGSAALQKRIAEIEALAAQFESSELPDAVEGQTLVLEKRVALTRQGENPYIRIRVSCPWHSDCSKSRSLFKSQRYGMKEPIAYLGCWIRAGDRHLDHWQPSEGDIRSWLQDHKLL